MNGSQARPEPASEPVLAARTSWRDVSIIFLLTIAALLVHGYHSGIEDAAIYLPAIKKLLHPGLYPFDSDFFVAQTRFTLFDELIASIVRVTGIPLSYTLFAGYILFIFLVLLGCLRLSRLCFAERAAHWGSVAMIAALLTIPVTGTALYIMDQHLHPRSLSTAAVLFALTFVLEKRYLPAALLFFLGALIHAQMTFYGLLMAVLLAVRPIRTGNGFIALAAAPAINNTPTFNEIWARVSATRIHHYPLKWAWYLWVGIVGPPVLLAWFSTFRRHREFGSFSHLCRRTALYGALSTIAAVLLTAGPQPHRLANLQPMRSFQLIYLIFFIVAGGLIGRWILRGKPVRWVLFFIPLCFLMFTAQRAEFPASPHVELPGCLPANDWLRAFDWVRLNTPRDAYFALDPRYMDQPGEDNHGFRALAERSMMADYIKDVAVVALSVTARTIGAGGPGPSGLPLVWYEHMKALRGWKDFKLEDFKRLKQQFGVTWVLLEKPGFEDMPCEYENAHIKVCRIP